MRVQQLQERGFIALMALLMTVTALGTDIMMPALSQMSQDFHLGHANQIQLVIAVIFFGMALGFCIYGPLSDAFGRKPILYLGLSIYIVGSLLAIFTTHFNVLLFARVLQGFGAAACRIIPGVMIRDKFSGDRMAQIYSLIMVLFIIEPAVSPSIGQAFLLFSDWRFLFVVLLVLGIVCAFLVWKYQEETLAKEKRIPLNTKNILSGVKTTLTHPVSVGYTLISGLIAGAFTAYLSTAQQILQSHYQLGAHFPLVFGVLALCIGIGSYFNSKLVMTFGMNRMSLWGAGTQCVLSLFLALYMLSSRELSLTSYLLYLSVTLFTIGMLFGNLNSLALEPMGEIAGIANSVISGIQALMSVFVGIAIGYFYSDSAFPLIAGFFITSAVSVVYLRYLARFSDRQNSVSM
ncbi:multidrug effflux MFS transporter [Vibrio sp. S4M6]|uniref:multidrug effflux MFS transporter n=1 Tax=Vibrio sinus TaxID=2946865 RepID=UPI00202AAED4|nr:multidrug effflux MFS transporter [Vibrio sinus]MCL9780209.1 multidrug effflux MFS transporter [Vibrio sinus]